MGTQKGKHFDSLPPSLSLRFYLSRGSWADGRSWGSTAGPGARLQGSPHCPPQCLCPRCCQLCRRPLLLLHPCPPRPQSHHHPPPRPPRLRCSGAWLAPMCPGNASILAFIVIILMFLIIRITINCLQVLPYLHLNPGRPALPWFLGRCSQCPQSHCFWRFWR